MRLLPSSMLGIGHIELVTTLTVVGVLTAVALPSLMRMEEQARMASMQTVASAMAHASNENWAMGQLRGEAVPVTRCKDAPRLLINITQSDDQLRWQDQHLEVTDGDDLTPPPYRQCLLREAANPERRMVRFYVHLCADRTCK